MKANVEDLLTTLLTKVDARAEHDDKVIASLTELGRVLSETYVQQINCLIKARDTAFAQVDTQASIIAKQNEIISSLQNELIKYNHKLFDILDKSRAGVTINQ